MKNILFLSIFGITFIFFGGISSAKILRSEDSKIAKVDIFSRTYLYFTGNEPKNYDVKRVAREAKSVIKHHDTYLRLSNHGISGWHEKFNVHLRNIVPCAHLYQIKHVIKITSIDRSSQEYYSDGWTIINSETGTCSKIDRSQGFVPADLFNH